MKVLKMKSRSLVLLVLSIVCFAVSASSLCLIPVKWIDENVKIFLVSLLVWLGFAGGMVLTLILGAVRRTDGEKTYPFPGIVCFFKNKTAAICDVLWLLCAVVLIVLRFSVGTRSLAYIVFLSLTLFGCCLHAILNGNNFAYVKREEN